MVTVEPHPLLNAGILVTEFPDRLGELPTPSEILEYLSLSAKTPLARSAEVRPAIRDLFRHGGYKPTGRGRPASEYLAKAVEKGSLPSINRAVDISKIHGAKRCLLLPVSAPFHCAMMTPAADVMAKELASTQIQSPVVPVISNVSARPEQEPNDIRRLLVEQVTSKVRWRECILTLRELGITSLLEIGAGKILSGMTRRIDKEIESASIQSVEQLEEFMNTL